MRYALSIALTALLFAGCSKPSGTTSPAASNNPSAAAPAPFQPDGNRDVPANPNAATVAAPAPNGTAMDTHIAAADPAPARLPDIERIVIPAGTPVTVRLAQTISSATANPGDRFEATLDEPLQINNAVIAQRGATVTGHVVEARHSGRLHHPGVLRLALDNISVNGHPVPVRSSAYATQGRSHKKRNWAWIGGSSAGGALIGGLVGGGKGALIGSLAGAGAGTTTAFVTGKHDVVLAAERRLTFRIGSRNS